MIDIKDANLRDASWITANLRPIDREEVYAQLPDGLPTKDLAAYLLLHDAYAAFRGSDPVMLFGASPMTVNVLSVWAMGTKDMARAVPGVSRFFLDYVIPERIKQGFDQAEARSMASHTQAHRWIESLGGEQHGPAFAYGKHGEPFVLYRWTVAQYRAIGRQSRWSKP